MRSVCTSIAACEQRIAVDARRRLAAVPGVTLFGPACPDLGVIPFTVDGWDHRLVAAVLGHEHGVGIRSGCFCAQPYVHHLLGLDRDAVGRWVAAARRGDLRHAPGLVRIGLGGYNDRHEIERAVTGLHQLVAGDVRGRYRQQRDGSFLPAGDRSPRWFTPN